MHMLKASIIKKQENRKVAKTAQPNLPKQFEKILSGKEEDRSRRLRHRPWVMCKSSLEFSERGF